MAQCSDLHVGVRRSHPALAGYVFGSPAGDSNTICKEPTGYLLTLEFLKTIFIELLLFYVSP